MIEVLLQTFVNLKNSSFLSLVLDSWWVAAEIFERSVRYKFSISRKL